MSSYQTNFINNELKNVISELQNLISSPLLKDVFDKYDFMARNDFLTPDYAIYARNLNIKSALKRYIINGVEPEEAKLLATIDYHTPMYEVKIWLDAYCADFCRHNQPQKIYAAHALKKAGCSNKKIALILRTYPNKIRQFLSEKIDFN